MVVRIQLTIKSIRGQTFQIDTDVDSDILGLKVQIWESQNIPIENQRLVFSGKELQDNSKLIEFGIGDNAIIFLVESSSQVQQPQPEITQVQVQVQPSPEPQVVTSSYNYDNSSNDFSYQPQAVNVNGYQQFNDEMASQTRIQHVLKLGFWVRLYCIFGMIITGISIFNCLFSIIPYLMYTMGFLGTRKLNRCLLVFPLLIVMIVGFSLTFGSIYWMTQEYYPFEILFLVIGILHLITFSCICKLMCRISQLSQQEWWQARVQIQSKGCCC